MINLSFQNEEIDFSVDGATAQPADQSSQSNFKRAPAESVNGATVESAQLKKVNNDLTKVYDPYAFGNTDKATSFWGIVGHLIVFSFGPTLLSIPSTFINAGYVTGFVCTIITVSLYAHCMRMVISSEYELCKRMKKPKMSYVEMVQEAFNSGPVFFWKFSKLTQIIIYCVFLCIWLGGNSILFILLSENLRDMCKYFLNVDTSGRVLLLFLIVPLVLLCWIPNLKWLVPLSLLTNFVNLVSICIIYYVVLSDMPPLSTRKPFGHWTSIPLLIGVQLFSINVTSLLIPLKNELKIPKRFNSKFGVITTAYVLVGLMYSIFGLLCYIRYGDNTKESVILNLPATTFNKILISLYSVGLVGAFPLFSYVSFDIIWNNMLKDRFQKSKYRIVYEYMCRTMIPLSSMFFAYVVPNLPLFLSLTGTVGTSIDSLIIPALTEMLIYYKQGRYFLFVKNIVIILTAGVLIVMGSADCITQLINNFSNAHEADD